MDVSFGILSDYTIADALRTALSLFAPFRTIDLDISHYEVYVAKKSGLPKLDYPSFEAD